MNAKAAAVFSRLTLPDHTIRIKLLGDSITHGVGGTGFDQNGEPITAGFARNPDGYCWAALFRDDLEARYDCKVVNNGCTGTTIEFVLDRFDELVDPEDDIILCTIGTNNRNQDFDCGPKASKREDMERFYGNILKLNDRLLASGKAYVLVANIPAGRAKEVDGETFWRIFHMNDVHDMYVKAAAECGFPFISMYEAFTDYCESTGTPLDSLLADALHPNDEGYRVYFSLLMRELGLARPLWEG